MITVSPWQRSLKKLKIDMSKQSGGKAATSTGTSEGKEEEFQ